MGYLPVVNVGYKKGLKVGFVVVFVLFFYHVLLVVEPILCDTDGCKLGSNLAETYFCNMQIVETIKVTNIIMKDTMDKVAHEFDY